MKKVLCPRCCLDLQPGKYADMDLFLCPTCRGVLIAQHRLPSVLDTLARSMREIISPDDPIELVKDKGAVGSCPACRNPMENYGYMGSKAILIDRCNSCDSYWIDALELGAMSLLYARTELRAQVVEKELDRVRKEAQQVADNNAITSAIGRFMMGGFKPGL
jgi:Zn-finger nucleic acid-binding protein